MTEVIITKNNFEEEVLNYNGKVLVDFWAPWCGPCKMIAPILEEIAREYEGQIKIGKINIDKEVELAINYKVISIPTLIIFENGELIQKTSGYMDKEELIEFIDL